MSKTNQTTLANDGRLLKTLRRASAFVVLTLFCSLPMNCASAQPCTLCPDGATDTAIGTAFGVFVIRNGVQITLSSGAPVGACETLHFTENVQYAPVGSAGGIGAGFSGGSGHILLTRRGAITLPIPELVADVTPVDMATTVVGPVSCPGAVGAKSMNASSYAITPADVTGGFLQFRFEFTNGLSQLPNPITGECLDHVNASPQRNVTVAAAPTCSIAPATLTVCEGAPASFTGTAIGTSPFTYCWKKGCPGAGACLSTAATLAIASAKAADAGCYELTVTDAFGCTTTCQATLTVNPIPTCNITGDTPVCPRTTHTYTSAVSPAGGTVAHSWSISGSGTINGSTTGASVSVTAGASGSFTLTDNVTRDGCPGQCTLTVPINPTPTCAITGDTPVCAGTTHTYTSAVSPAGGTVAHSWSISGSGTINGSTTGASVSVTAGASGSFTLTDNITRDGCPGQCTLTVPVNPCDPRIVVHKQVVCVESGRACGAFGPELDTDNKSATGVKGTTCPAFCYRITVENTGNVDLTGVTVTDNELNLGACNFPSMLAVGQKVQCVIPQVEVCALGNTANTVVAQGQSVIDSGANGHTASTNSATVTVVPVSVACDIALFSPSDQDNNSNNNHVLLTDSGAVRFTLTITNTGQADLTVAIVGLPCSLDIIGNPIPTKVTVAAGQSSAPIVCNVDVSCPEGANMTVTVRGTTVASTSGPCASFDITGQPVSTSTQCTGRVDCQSSCLLSVTKTACVVTNAPTAESCTGGAIALTLQYTGETINSPTIVQVEGSGGTIVAYGLSSLNHGDILTMASENGFTIDATAHGSSKLGAQTTVTINGSYEVLHTSCSCRDNPETNLKVCNPMCLDASSPDNPTGTKGPASPLWTLVALKDPGLGVIICPTTQPTTPECSTQLPPLSANTGCKGSIHALSLAYEGGGCAAMQNLQGAGKVTCTNLLNEPTASPVRIRITDGGGGKVFLDKGVPASVILNDIIEVVAGAKKDDHFSADMVITIYDANDTLIERVKLKSDCSQPVKLGDLYGGLRVVGMTSKDNGTITLGSEVKYTYVIQNNGLVALSNVTVVDDVLGPVPGSPIAELGPGETVTLTETVLISGSTTNTVTVAGFLGPVKCSATATAAVTAPPPPPTAVECTSGIVGFLVKYTGPDLPDPTTITFTGSQSALVTASYSFPGGLANGTVLTLAGESDPGRLWTIDATKHGQTKLGTKTSVYFNTVLTEILHTSCSCRMNNFVPGLPACLDASSPDNPTGTKGEPSLLFQVLDFK